MDRYQIDMKVMSGVKQLERVDINVDKILSDIERLSHTRPFLKDGIVIYRDESTGAEMRLY